jgi:uncharacterized protein
VLTGGSKDKTARLWDAATSQRSGAALQARMGEGRAQDAHHFDRHGFDPSAWTRARHPSRSIIEVAIGIAGELMNGMAYDQDINCRTVGRCIFGSPLDREVGDLVPDVPIEEDLGRDFLYARYDAELTREGLDELSLAKVDTARVTKLDSVEAIDDLLLIGQRYAEKYLKLETQIGLFLPGRSQPAMTQ